MSRWYNDLLRDDAMYEGMDKPKSRYQYRDNKALIAAADRVIAEWRRKELLGEKEP